MSKMEWITLHTTFEGDCIICKEKIPVGELAEWNKEEKQIRHHNCAKSTEIQDLLNKAKKLEEDGNGKKANELYEMADHLDFKELLKNYDETKAVATTEQKELFAKKLEESQLYKDAKNYDYPEFLRQFKKLYFSLARQAFGDNTYVKLRQNFREPEKERKFGQDIGMRHFKAWTTMQTFLISKDTPEENKEHFRTVFSKCQDYIYWSDRYIDEESIEYLLAGITSEKIKEVKLLSTIFTKQIDDDLKKSFQTAKNQLSQKEINCTFHVITSKKVHDEMHDRFVLGSNIAWNAPSVGQIKNNQLSEITESPNHDKLVQDFEKFCNDSSCLDLINDWVKIDEELEKKQKRRKYRRHCLDCGKSIIVWNQYRNKPKCHDCLTS